MRGLVVLALAGCIEPNLTPCGDLLCPHDEVCVERAHGCYAPERVEACAALQDGSPCQTLDIPVGVCANDICVTAGCGDGLVEVGEECDGSIGDATCLDRGYYGATGLACTAECRFDTTSCSGGYCGDHLINGPETCDGERPTDISCFAVGYDYGPLGCSSICGIDTSACARIGFTVESTTAPTTPFLFDMIEVEGVVFASGKGTIHRRTSGTWVAETLPAIITTSSTIVTIWGSSLSNIYAATNDGHLLHYDGATWSEQTFDSSVGIRAIRGTAANDVFLVGTNGAAYHFDGSTWQAIPTGVTALLAHLAVVATNDVYAVGSDGTLLHWDGATWTSITNPWTGTNATIPTVEAGGGTIYVPGTSGRVFAFDGSQWKLFVSPYSSNFRVVVPTARGAFLAGIGPQVGDNNVLQYFEAGHFTRVLVPSGGALTLVSGLATTDGEHLFGSLGVGNPAIVLALRGPVWAGEQLANTVDIVDVTVALGGGVYAIGIETSNGSNRIYRHDAYHWTQMFDAGSTQLTSIVARADDDIFVTTDAAIVYHWDGAAWTPQPSPVAFLNGVSWAPSRDVYASGLDGLTYYDGSTWISINFGGPFSDVHVFADGQVVAIGDFYSAHYDGVAWTTVDDAQIGGATSVWGAAPNDVYAVGPLGRVLHFDGVAWTSIDLGIPENITGISGTAADDIWVATAFGAIWHYDGISWAPVRSRFDPAALPVFTRVDATPSAVVFGAKNGRPDILLRP